MTSCLVLIHSIALHGRLVDGCKNASRWVFWKSSSMHTTTRRVEQLQRALYRAAHGQSEGRAEEEAQSNNIPTASHCEYTPKLVIPVIVSERMGFGERDVNIHG